MRHDFLAPLLAALTLCSLPAIPALASNLQQTYQQALAYDAVYQSARYALRAGAEKGIQGRAGLLPSVNLGGTYTRSGDTLNNLSNVYNLTLTQPLLRLANWESYRQGKLAVAVSEAQFELARQDLILRVGQSYFDVLAAQDVLSSLGVQKQAITEQLASAQRNFEVGTATITDTNEAQARYDLANAQEIAAQNDLAVALDKMQQIIGQQPPPLSRLRDKVTLSMPQPSGLDAWIASAEQQNYNVMAQQISLEIAQSEIKRSRADHMPTVDLVVGRNFTNQYSTLTPYTNARIYSNSVGVQWNIPLYSGFAVSSKVDENIALADKARADLDNARRTAVLNVRQAYLGVSNGLAQVKAYEAAQVSSQSALDSNRLGYQVGVRINIDVLNAQQQLFSTQRDLAKARYDTLMNGLKLKAAAGALQEADLVQIDTLLGPPAP